MFASGQPSAGNGPKLRRRDQAESGYYSAVLPDQIEAGATIENGLREADKVSRR